MRSGVALVAVLLQGAAAQAAPTLEQLKAEVDALNFSAAAKVIEQLRATRGLSRAAALELCLQEGLVKAALKDADGAREAFTRALLIDPELKLPGKPAPRVLTPFLEAKGWVKSVGGLGLALETVRPETGDGWTARAKPVVDPKGLVAELAFVITEDGATRTATVRAAEGAVLEGRGTQVRIAWQLLSANQWVLAEGSAAPAAPTAAVPAVAVVAPPVAPAPAPKATGAASFPKFPGVIALSVGAGVGLLGAAFFGLAAGDANQARLATTWEVVQKQSSQGRSSQTMGGVLTGIGSVVAASGIVMLVVSGVSGSARTKVSLAPMPGGGALVVSGPLW